MKKKADKKLMKSFQTKPFLIFYFSGLPLRIWNEILLLFRTLFFRTI